MAVYRQMDIGTAKPTVEERARVPHHLIDVIGPDQEFSVSDYVESAEAAIGEIRSRGREALFVGGTPLYLKGLLRGIFKGPPADPEFRRQLKEEAEQLGAGVLHARLAEVDPAAAEKLHPNDTRRLIRALEVYEKTGQPISRLQKQFDISRPAEDCHVSMLDWPREQLQQRIDQRVDAMFAQGLVDEVRRLLDKPQGVSKTAGQAVGYRELIEHLAGKHDLAQTIELVKTHTRQLAKRQETWFRSLSECRRVPLSEEIDAADVARRILS
jgi:tRNA dimethylallyltransferase